MIKTARTDHPICEPLAARWSPYRFADRDVADADLRSLLEAARWSASAFNEQPWHYLVARRRDGDAYQRLLSCLVEANRRWARAAPVLVLTVVAEAYRRNGKPNASALHDLGQASANLSTEATIRGLAVHQMAGILPDRARELFDIPAGYRAVTALAVGHHAAREGLTAEELGPDGVPRERKRLAEFVFTDRWGRPADLLEG